MTLKELITKLQKEADFVESDGGGVSSAYRECAGELEKVLKDCAPRPEPPTYVEIAKASKLGFRFSAHSIKAPPRMITWPRVQMIPAHVNPKVGTGVLLINGDTFLCGQIVGWTDWRVETKKADPVGWSTLKTLPEGESAV